MVEDLAALQVETSTAGTQWGTGGMATKLTAARIACAAGCHMAICHSDKPFLISRIMAGEQLGTIFKPLSAKIRDRKRWILSGEVLSMHTVAGILCCCCCIFCDKSCDTYSLNLVVVFVCSWCMPCCHAAIRRDADFKRFAVPVRGKVHVDAGCAQAIQQKKNLYAAGIVRAEGTFGVLDAVELIHGNTVVARGLTNYTSHVRDALTCSMYAYSSIA